MQVVASAHQLMSLQEAGQLPNSSLQHALSITDTALTSAKLAGKGIDSIYATELLGLTARGLYLVDSTAVAVAETAVTDGTGSTARRHLLAAPDGYTFSLASQESVTTLKQILDRIAAELQSQAGPAIGWVSASQADLSVSVSERLGASFENFTLAVGPQIIISSSSSSTPAYADATNTANALITPLAALKGPGQGSVIMQLEMVQDPAWFIFQSPDTSDAMIESYKASVWNTSLTPVGPPLINLTLLTPAVAVKFPQAEGHVGDTTLCADPTGNATVDCRVAIDIPITKLEYVDRSRLLLCLRIVDGSLIAATSTAGGWEYDNSTTASTSLRCVTSKQGTYVIAAVDRVDTTPPPQPSPSPAPVVNVTANATNTTACNGTDVACNVTGNVTVAVNVTSNDTSTTTTPAQDSATNTTNTTTTTPAQGGGGTQTPPPDQSTGTTPPQEAQVDGGTAIPPNDPTGSPGSNTSSTTDGSDTGTQAPPTTNATSNATQQAVSPSPSPVASPSPKVSPSPSPRPSPAPVQQGVAATAAAKLTGWLINLGAVKDCAVSKIPAMFGIRTERYIRNRDVAAVKGSDKSTATKTHKTPTQTLAINRQYCLCRERHSIVNSVVAPYRVPHRCLQQVCTHSVEHVNYGPDPVPLLPPPCRALTHPPAGPLASPFSQTAPAASPCPPQPSPVTPLRPLDPPSVWTQCQARQSVSHTTWCCPQSRE